MHRDPTHTPAPPRVAVPEQPRDQRPVGLWALVGRVAGLLGVTVAAVGIVLSVAVVVHGVGPELARPAQAALMGGGLVFALAALGVGRG